MANVELLPWPRLFCLASACRSSHTHSPTPSLSPHSSPDPLHLLPPGAASPTPEAPARSPPPQPSTPCPPAASQRRPTTFLSPRSQRRPSCPTATGQRPLPPPCPVPPTANHLPASPRQATTSPRLHLLSSPPSLVSLLKTCAAAWVWAAAAGFEMRRRLARAARVWGSMGNSSPGGIIRLSRSQICLPWRPSCRPPAGSSSTSLLPVPRAGAPRWSPDPGASIGIHDGGCRPTRHEPPIRLPNVLYVHDGILCGGGLLPYHLHLGRAIQRTLSSIFRL